MVNLATYRNDPKATATGVALGTAWAATRLMRDYAGVHTSTTPSNTLGSFYRDTRYEVQALQRQGLSRSEAFDQIRQFNNGAADGYLFHFTTPRGAQGILNDGVINASRTGVWGSGVYTGTIPTPNPILKNVPFIGWGLGGKGANVRIPFQTSQQSVTPLIPPYTKVFREPVKVGDKP